MLDARGIARRIYANHYAPAEILASLEAAACLTYGTDDGLRFEWEAQALHDLAANTERFG